MLLGYFSPIDALLPVALPQDELTKSQLSCLAAALKGMTCLEEPHLLAVCQALAKSNNTNMEVCCQKIDKMMIIELKINFSLNINAHFCIAHRRL